MKNSQKSAKILLSHLPFLCFSSFSMDMDKVHEKEGIPSLLEQTTEVYVPQNQKENKENMENPSPFKKPLLPASSPDTRKRKRSVNPNENTGEPPHKKTSRPPFLSPTPTNLHLVKKTKTFNCKIQAQEGETQQDCFIRIFNLEKKEPLKRFNSEKYVPQKIRRSPKKYQRSQNSVQKKRGTSTLTRSNAFNFDIDAREGETPEDFLSRIMKPTLNSSHTEQPVAEEEAALTVSQNSQSPAEGHTKNECS